jgi:hypothetical protein
MKIKFTTETETTYQTHYSDGTVLVCVKGSGQSYTIGGQ